MSNNSSRMLINLSDMANEVNHYFTGIMEQLASLIQSRSGNSSQVFDSVISTPSNQSSIFVTPSNPDETYALISNLNVNKSSGIDQISNKL